MTALRDLPHVVEEATDSPWIVRAELVDAHSRAEDIIAEAEGEAARLRAEAAAEAERAREAAEETGLREGAAAAAALIAEVSAGVEATAAAWEADISRLAFAIAHRIIGEFAEDERMILAVRTALVEYRDTAGLRLRVSAQMEPVLRAALAQSGAGLRVDIEVDEDAWSGACTLIHPRGRVAVGPFDQLQALRDAAEPRDFA
jgi:flagellar biosynthesis/type III secretory pathway protein FliH